MIYSRARPLLFAIVGAILFGASAPLAKVLLGEAHPVLLAGLLYLGCGAGLLAFSLARSAFGVKVGVQLTCKDTPWLAGAVLAGGVAAPIMLLLGLQSTPAATASLLLNFECVATTLIAAFMFQEYVGERAWAAIGLITASSGVLSFDGAQFGASLGAVSIIVACVLWGLDNNLTRSISSKDPVSIGIVKGTVSGAFSLALALLLGAPLPGPFIIMAAMLVGSLCYGLSIALFILSMRHIGAARASALMGTAPFAGVIVSFLIFRGAPDTSFYISAPLMVLGALLLFGEEHAHTHIHVHGTITHEHIHRHDDQHRHH